MKLKHQSELMISQTHVGVKGNINHSCVTSGKKVYFDKGDLFDNQCNPTDGALDQKIC